MLDDFASGWTWSDMTRRKKMHHVSMLMAEAGEGKATTQSHEAKPRQKANLRTTV
jgi:hypothetical protein